ncbi:S1C family serine protease [Risungbinella massiliensis]|uniref:S1C family serine protease n=1 Tax=Risungbinella massiliensis TaxID=1329796 RepID=UPI0005CB9396|nr:S1C family serine protease [Risungbinella massiliensis]
MSLYDQPEFYEEKKEVQPPSPPSEPPEPSKPKRKKPRWLVPMVSAIIGGIVALLISPLLTQSGIIPAPKSPVGTSEIQGPYQTTSVKVNSEITEAVDKVRSAVVGIENIGFSSGDNNSEDAKQGTGSGIIFQKKDGKAHVVTNYHVIEGAKEVRVTLPLDNQPKTVPAKVLGSDPITDLAVLEIGAEDVKVVAQFGNSDTLRPGEPAIAIGNPLGPQFSQSVTVGVISSTRRTIKITERLDTDVIQTDAAINPGNSGGALVNSSGQVIGINSLKIAQSGVEGLGFAIPSNDALPIIQALIQHGRVPRPYLGVTLVDLEKLPTSIWQDLQVPANIKSGVVIDEVDFNTPARTAGLREKDIIVALDNQPVASSSDIRRFLYKNKAVNSTVNVTFYRNGSKQTVAVQLSDTPQ